MKYIIFLIYVFIISMSMGAFWSFRPFQYIDNYESRVICNNNQIYQTGPSVIFSSDGTIDAWNEKKTEKLCAFGMVLDYYDMYKAPGTVNYRFSPAYQTDSSWQQAIFAFFVVGGFGILVAEALLELLKINYKVNWVFIGAVILGGILLFFFLFQKPFNYLYCQKKAILVTWDFRRSANRSGKTMPKEEEGYIKTIKQKVFSDCMR